MTASAERGERLLLAPVAGGAPTLDTIHNINLLTLCNTLPPQSVDMILADLPYGTTACSWDEVIPFEPMWKAFKRVIKPRGAIVLTASQPFTSRLVCSNLEMFKYEIIWKKTRPSGFLHAKNKVLKNHEDILVFSLGSAVHESQSDLRMVYNPQKGIGKAYIKQSDPKINLAWSNMLRPSTNKVHTTLNKGDRYPTSVITFSNDNHNSLHPTQKPVALFEYLIRTYTRPGDVVLDPVVGSGTTAVAARNTGRRFVCGDRDAGYVDIAKKRLRDTDPFQDRHVSTGAIQHSLFAGINI